jgi:hypothetical protein
MKRELLTDIKWAAHRWGVWSRMAKRNPLFEGFQKQSTKSMRELVILCAMYRVWMSYEWMRPL